MTSICDITIGYQIEINIKNMNADSLMEMVKVEKVKMLTFNFENQTLTVFIFKCNLNFEKNECVFMLRWLEFVETC